MLNREHALSILSLKDDYDQATLKRAYRCACLRFPHDKGVGEYKKFHEISTAYELLKGGASREGANLKQGV